MKRSEVSLIKRDVLLRFYLENKITQVNTHLTLYINKMKYNLIIIIFLLSIAGCAKIIRPENMNYHFDTSETKLNTLLNIDGYYISKFEYKGNIHYSALMFYRNGSIAFPLRQLFSSENEIIENLVDKDTSKANNFDTSWGGWGIYHLSGDTIKMQTSLWYDRVTRMGSTYSVFVIENKNEIRLIDGWYKEKRDIYKFVPYPNRIDSTNWLLKKKWFYKKDK